MNKKQIAAELDRIILVLRGSSCAEEITIPVDDLETLANQCRKDKAEEED